MAEVTAMRNNATIFPVYGLPYTISYPMLDADGDLITGATTPDAEVSLNGDTFADCTNESTEIATNSGIYYLTLTAAEMTADIVSIIAKSATSGMKTTSLVLYPRKLPILLTSDNAGAYDSTTTINLGSSAVAIDDYYNGCLVYIYDGTGSGQVRMITDYVGSTKLATVHVAWATNPDATSDLKIYRTEQAPYVSNANVMAINGTAQTARDIGASVLLSSGTGTGQLDFTSGVVKSNLSQILGTALTETAGYLSAGFKKFFNVATPVMTAESVNQTGDSYAVVTNADYGNAKLVRSTTPANTLSVDVNNKVAVPDAQKVDVNTIKAQSVTCTGAFDLDATSLRVLRTYYINNNKMNVTDATGVVALRNDTDTGNLATGSVTDNLTTTTRTALTWA